MRRSTRSTPTRAPCGCVTSASATSTRNPVTSTAAPRAGTATGPGRPRSPAPGGLAASTTARRTSPRGSRSRRPATGCGSCRPAGEATRGGLWLDGPVKVARGGDSLVVTAGGDPARYARLAAQAVTDVREVLRSWRGSLVVEVPSSEEQLERVLGADKGEYSAIAAVTTTVDGSLAADSPVHVFVNPKVFDGLGAKGSQVVLSHEATHVATDASFATHADLAARGVRGLRRARPRRHPAPDGRPRQILRRVREKGAPDGAPDRAGPRPDGAGAGRDVRGGLDRVPLPRPALRRADDGGLLPRRRRRT